MYLFTFFSSLTDVQPSNAVIFTPWDQTCTWSFSEAAHIKLNCKFHQNSDLHRQELCSKNFRSSLTTSTELTQAVTKSNQSNITSAKRQQGVQKWKWESAFIYIYFSPSSAEHRNSSSSKTKGRNPPPHERTPSLLVLKQLGKGLTSLNWMSEKKREAKLPTKYYKRNALIKSS